MSNVALLTVPRIEIDTTYTTVPPYTAVSIYENGWGGGGEGETSGGLPRIRTSIRTKYSIIICFSSNFDHFVFAIR